MKSSWNAITRARTKARPVKAKLSPEQVENMVKAVLDGASYYAAGKAQGVSGATARYHFLRGARG